MWCEKKTVGIIYIKFSIKCTIFQEYQLVVERFYHELMNDELWTNCRIIRVKDQAMLELDILLILKLKSGPLAKALWNTSFKRMKARKSIFNSKNSF